jgi:putative Mg2+ transporter-C (MgtC) family protein
MTDHWEILDLYKALLAVGAGLILGLERELKDKAAGLKTITIITLGAALFSIVSYKAGGPGNSTQIAAYIVSGVGFLGAGVIFKDGFTVSGLTTAGIIWMAAAIGTSIGFGEFYMAITFLVASLLVIVITPFINTIFVAKRQTRQLEIVIDKANAAHKKGILDAITRQGIRLEEKKMELKEGRVLIGAEVIIREDQFEWLETYLLNNAYIVSFSV